MNLAPASGTVTALPNTHGVALGDVSADSAILWARSDRPARMYVRLDSDGVPGTARSVSVDADHDFTGRVTVTGLKPATEYRYSVWFTDTAGGENTALPAEGDDTSAVGSGSFRTSPSADRPASVRFAWGGDLAGQNMCRDRDRGFAIFEHISAMKLDFFIALGDMIYADGVCEARGLYGNEQIPGAPLATDIGQFWGHWKYARDDRGYREFLARVPTFSVWDDHEIINDSGPAHDTRDEAPYRENVHLLPLGLRAFLDYSGLPKIGPETSRLYRSARFGKHVEMFLLDTRQYRDSNGKKDTDAAPKSMLGKTQRVWLEQRISGSNATWKVIVSSVPMSIPTGADPPEAGRDGWANHDQETGFERELLGILRNLQRAGVKRTIWLTTDVHFAAGFTYRPFADDPEFVVHEWVSGPMNAGLFPNQEFDTTLNPQREFIHGPEDEKAVKDYAESLEWMNVGRIDIDEAGVLSMSIVNGLGNIVHQTTLKP